MDNAMNCFGTIFTKNRAKTRVLYGIFARHWHTGSPTFRPYGTYWKNFSIIKKIAPKSQQHHVFYPALSYRA